MRKGSTMKYTKDKTNKLSEFAALLKSAKKKNDPIVESDVSSTDSVVSNLQEEETPVVDFGIRVPEQPAEEQSNGKTSLIVAQLQKDIQNLKKLVETQSARPIYQPSYSGGGADNLSNIDRTVKTVTTDYTLTIRDWYVGVNASEIVTITLPTKVKNGKEFVVKDESGHAELTPIRIIGNIDNDVNGVEIRIDNGSVTLLYNNGWRII
jgi:hypothetical protein